MRYQDIATALGCTERQIRGWVNHHCPKKNRSYDDSYFDKIDTTAKAYFLGYIYADGWVTYRTVDGRQVGHELGMQLQRGDRYILERLSGELGNVHAITDGEKVAKICNNKFETHAQFSLLRIYSARIVRSLLAKGITPEKTYSDQFPVVDPMLFPHFLRGYFDGDGCVTSNRYGMAQVHFTAFGASFLKYAHDVLLDRYQINSTIYSENSRKHRLVIFRYDDVRRFSNLIYQNSGDLRLERKYNKFVDLNGLAA